MTRQCKECVFANNNKLREVIKDVISCVNNEHTRLEQENTKLKEKLETLQDEIGYLKSVLGQIKDLAMCGDCDYDCDNCMQGQIDKLIKEALNGRED